MPTDTNQPSKFDLRNFRKKPDPSIMLHSSILPKQEDSERKSQVNLVALVKTPLKKSFNSDVLVSFEQALQATERRQQEAFHYQNKDKNERILAKKRNSQEQMEVLKQKFKQRDKILCKRAEERKEVLASLARDIQDSPKNQAEVEITMTTKSEFGLASEVAFE